MAERSHRTRSSTKESVWLVESLSENHPPGLLPVKLDVLKEALWQEQSGGNISCPVQHGTNELKCEDPAVGCQSSGQCSVRKLLNFWREAGIKTLGSRGVKTKIELLLKEYKDLKKSRSKSSEAAVIKRHGFRDRLASQCFDILAPDAKEDIQKDRLRSQADKDSDLAFIEDQVFGARKMRFTSVDTVYSARVEKRKSRELGSQSRVVQEEARVATESEFERYETDGTQTLDFVEGVIDLDCSTELGEDDSEGSPVKKQRRVQPGQSQGWPNT